MARRVLTRDFVRESLYHAEYGYFATQNVINHAPQPLPFPRFAGEADYRAALREVYAARPAAWLTPAEIFRPHYAHAMASSMLHRYRSHDAATGARIDATPLRILEIGGGTGAHAADVLDYVRSEAPAVYGAAEYWLLEVSSTLAEAQRTLLEARHPGKTRVVVGDATAGPEALAAMVAPADGHWFIVLLEVLDNLPHDKIRLVSEPGDRSTGFPYLELAQVDMPAENGPPQEVWTSLTDPWAQNVLRSVPALARQLDPEYVASPSYVSSGARSWLPGALGDFFLAPDHRAAFLPTGAALLFAALCHVRPDHTVLAADFDHLPPPERVEDPFRVPDDASLDAFGSPIVSGRNAAGDGVIDHGSYLLPPGVKGTADIFFPVAFAALRELYRGIAREHGAQATAAEAYTAKSSKLMQRWAPASGAGTRTASGYNPLFEDFRNTSILMAASRRPFGAWL